MHKARHLGLEFPAMLLATALLWVVTWADARGQDTGIGTEAYRRNAAYLTPTQVIDANKDDLKKLQGKWKPQTSIRNGNTESPERGSIWIISGSKVFYPKFNSEEEIILDASKAPKEIDIRNKRPDGKIIESKG